jgi:hypothetical protein
VERIESGGGTVWRWRVDGSMAIAHGCRCTAVATGSANATDPFASFAKTMLVFDQFLRPTP